ncbi:MAG: alpha-amylase, partial [Longimicrobiales bacterium]
TELLWVDDDLYIMQRPGDAARPGLILVLNNRGDGWNGTWVSTRWRDTSLEPVAWWSARDLSRPHDQWAHTDGRAELWAPPRGYAIYMPRP